MLLDNSTSSQPTNNTAAITLDLNGYTISTRLGPFSVNENGSYYANSWGKPYNAIGIATIFGDGLGGFVYNDFINPTMNGIKVDNIKSESSLETLGEGWSINSNKNDGYPYIEGLYW